MTATTFDKDGVFWQKAVDAPTQRYCPGAVVFHVLNRGVGRRSLFTKDEDFLAFERVIEEALRTCRMRLSLRRGEREDPTSPILSTWPLPRPTDWMSSVNEPQSEAELQAFRGCVNRGHPFGDPARVTDTAERLGLEWTLRPRARPKKQQLPTVPIFPGCGRHLSSSRAISAETTNHPNHPTGDER